MKRVYVAGSTKDVGRVQAVQALIRRAGGQITFDWTTAEGALENESWDATALGAEIAVQEIDACRGADLVIVLCPPRGLGCWIEMGAALAGDADVWLVDPQRDSMFWQHPNVLQLTFADVTRVLDL